MLYESDVAQMTRFRARRKALLNHAGQIGACDRLESPATGGNQRVRRISQENPTYLIFLPCRERRLLIVRRLFFIQRGNGEVAEWSKALPC